jgi:hypothetical protein
MTGNINNLEMRPNTAFANCLIIGWNGQRQAAIVDEPPCEGSSSLSEIWRLFGLYVLIGSVYVSITAEGAGGNAEDSFEMANEMALIVESDPLCGLGDRHSRQRQQFSGTFQTAMNHKLIWRKMGGSLEHSGEMRRAETDLGGQVRQANVLADVVVNIGGDPA